MMDKESLERKLAGIKELKSMYSIPSWNAWNYLKTQNAYERLQAEVAARRLETDIKKPNLRELANLCRVIAWSFATAMMDINSQYIKQNEKMIIAPASRPGREYYAMAFSWAVDIPEKDALGRRDSEILNDEERSGVLKITPCYVDIICAYKRLQMEREGEDVLGGSMETRIRSQSAQSVMLDGESYSFRGLLQHCAIKREEIQLDMSGLGILFKLGGTTLEERAPLLAPDEAYERGCAEKTLYRWETERRIALSYVVAEGGDIDFALKGFAYGIRYARECIESLEKSDGPVQLLDHDRRLEKKLSYAARAIKRHRDWLAEVLSH